MAPETCLLSNLPSPLDSWDRLQQKSWYLWFVGTEDGGIFFAGIEDGEMLLFLNESNMFKL